MYSSALASDTRSSNSTSLLISQMTTQSHSKSFCLCVIKSQRVRWTTYNNIGLICKGSEDLVADSSENRRFRTPHSPMMLNLQIPAENIRTNLISPASCCITLYVISYIVWICPDSPHP